MPKQLTPEQKTRLEGLRDLPDAEIDLSDRPEVRDFTGAQRGVLYRPVKKQLTIRLDADVIEWFRSQGDGKGYQRRINAALREYVRDRQKNSSIPAQDEAGTIKKEPI